MRKDKRIFCISIKIDDMYFICCLPVCPPLISDEDIHQSSNSISEHNRTPYLKRFGRYFNKKDFDEEFDIVSLTDVSFSRRKIFNINIYFRIRMKNSLIKSQNYDKVPQVMLMDHRAREECYQELQILIIILIQIRKLMESMLH